jgi:hypothetical protein
LIVDATLLIIGKDLVSVRQLLELLSGSRVIGVLVRVVLEGTLLVGGFQLGLSSCRGDL